MIGKIKNPNYVAPENDHWRHEESNSEDESECLSEMVEKKLRFWYEKDGKRKRTPKVSPKVVAPKIVIKGKDGTGESSERFIHSSFKYYTNSVDVCFVEPAKKKSPQRLVDEPVLNPTDLIQQGFDLMKMTLDDFVKQSEDAKAAKEAETSAKNVEAESLKEKEAEGVVESDSSETEPEFDTSKFGVGKIIHHLHQSIQLFIFQTILKNQHLQRRLLHQVQAKVFLRFLIISGPGPISLDDIGDLFNEGKINVLTKKVSLLEKAKAKAEAEHDELKEKLEKMKAENVELKKAVNDHADRIDELTDDYEDQAKVIDRITAEFDEVNEKYELLSETNKTLHQMIGEMNESLSNENKVLRQEIEALRANKAIKDDQLNMLYTVMEHKLGINVQAVYNDLEIERVEA
ncbi:putative transcription factor bZIP family [Helianthus annuus]|nr:putative transcription factor bZIP family [Helianthus annuus]